MLLLGLKQCVWFTGTTCVVVVACLCSAPASVGSVSLPACEAKYATIEHVRLIGLSIAGASFEAEINPEGTETGYEFVIIGRQMHGAEPPEHLSGPVQSGRISAGTSAVAVSALLSGLQSSYIYWLEVVGTNLAGKTRSTPEDFFYDDPSAEGEQISDLWPYRPDESGCAIESGNLSAAKTLAEQQQKEAEVKTAEEAARKLRERERRRANARPSCVVPGLKGDTLHAARRRIAAAHCRLGTVKRPRDYHGPLVVARQTPRRGRRLKDGARIALTLGHS